MLSRSEGDAQTSEPARVLVGRDEQLALADRRWAAARSTAGHFLLIAGEAGIGKTRLLTEITARVDAERILVASVFPRDVEAVGGLLLDLGAALRRAGVDSVATALRKRLTEVADRSSDASRQRRMLVSDLAAIISDFLESQATLLGIEDLHWADELSLDVLERVATALPTSHSMVVATYRSDELYPRTPLRRVRTRLLEQRTAEEIRLPRLTAPETTELVRSLSGGEVADSAASSLFDRSDGIPLYIEELFFDDSSAVPVTIADSVALRTDALTPSTRPVLELAAVVGRSISIDLLSVVADSPREQLDAAIQELADRNLLLPQRDGDALDFRHALIREAVYESIPPLRKRDLHAIVAAAALEAGFGGSFVSDQFERARQPAEAYRHAIEAARMASHLSSHREAVELFQRAQRTAPSDLGVAERAALYAELAAEEAATDDNASAAQALTYAIEQYRSIGDEVSAALLVPRLVAARHLLGADYRARATLLLDAIRRVDEVPDAPVAARAALLAAVSAALMLDRCLDDAMEAASEASALTESSETVGERIDIAITLGAVEAFAGRADAAWQRLEVATRQAVDLQLETLAARGYRMLGTSASALVEYTRAERWIEDGLEYSAATERWNDYHYLNSHRAHVEWAVGHWANAKSVAARALDEGSGGVTTRNTALLVLGYLAMGDADFASARRYLTEAREIGERMQELQRLSPALWGLAETELLAQNPSAAVELAELAYAASEPLGDAAYIFPFLITGTRGYVANRDLRGAADWIARVEALVLSRSIPGTLPSIPHAQGLLLLAEGQTGNARALLEEAQAGWLAHRRFWDASRIAIDLAHCAARSRRPRDAALLLDAVRETAAGEGYAALRELADAVTLDDENLGVLSARELEVARLVASGATNRDIASALTISPKTASSHIEHILAKLGVARRAEIAAWVSRLPA